MSLAIHRIPSGPLDTNAYVLVDTEASKALVVDVPPGSAGAIANLMRDEALRLERIVITHGHWDHIGDLAALQATVDAPTHAHELVRDRIERPEDTAAPVPIDPARVDHLLREGDSVRIGEFDFAVLEMLGHDPGHIVLYRADDALMVGGDVLFPGGHGRTDIPGSDQTAMNRTLRRLLTLPDDTVVLPGHGDPVRVGNETPWIREIPAQGDSE